MSEKSINGYSSFTRKTLTRVSVTQINQDKYCARVATLSRASLNVTSEQLYVTKSTLKLIMGMSMKLLGVDEILSLMSNTK